MTRSCGCLRRDVAAATGRSHRWASRITHGHTAGGNPSGAYRSWAAMKQRCSCASQPGYRNYGGRGIKVYDRWINSFENFLEDMGERPDGMTLERVDNEKGYSPENCVWAGYKTQANNTRANRLIEVDGASKTLAERSRTTGVHSRTITDRISRGWPTKVAATAPLGTRYRHGRVILADGTPRIGREIDLTNQRFGRLTIISRARGDQHGYAKWNCRCDCGQVLEVISWSLRSGATQSCGCRQRELAAALSTKRARVVQVEGISRTLAEWAKVTGISYGAIVIRLNRGWPESVAVTAPKGTRYLRGQQTS